MNTPLERLEIAGDVTFTFLPSKSTSDEEIKKHERVAKRSSIKMGSHVRNIEQDINVYIMRKSGYRSTNKFTYEEAKEYFGVEKQDNNAINLIFSLADNAMPNSFPPTPWIILHRFAHAWYSFDIQDVWNAILHKVYGIGEDTLFGGKKEINENYSEFIMENLFTFRAARERKIILSHEGLIDLMVQSMVKGKAEMKPFVDIDSHDLYVQTDKAENLRKKFLNYIDRHVQKSLSKSVGVYFVI